MLRGSNHAPPLLEEDWQSIPLGPGDSQDLAIRKFKQKLVSDYWKLVSTMVSQGHDTIGVPGLDTNRVGAYSLLWTCYEYLSGMGRSLVIGGRMDYTYNLLASQRIMAKARTSKRISYLRMINGPSPCSRGLELVLNKGPFPRCLPSLGKPHYWSFLEMACFKRSELSMANVDR